jgi:hypothetical protein
MHHTPVRGEATHTEQAGLPIGIGCCSGPSRFAFDVGSAARMSSQHVAIIVLTECLVAPMMTARKRRPLDSGFDWM